MGSGHRVTRRSDDPGDAAGGDPGHGCFARFDLFDLFDLSDLFAVFNVELDEFDDTELVEHHQ